MKKVVVLALLLFVCVGSLLAQENDKRKKKSITDLYSVSIRWM